MAVYEFGSIVAYKAESGRTEQFGSSDYRFDLIKKETRPDMKLRIARHEFISDLDKTLYYKEGKFFSTMGFEIPVELLGLSSLHLKTGRYIRAYISAFITKMKGGVGDPQLVLRSIYDLIPFLDDGSLMVPKGKKTYDELKSLHWPDITPGVEKRLKNKFRNGGSLALFAIGFMYGDLNPNSQLQIMEHWENSDKIREDSLDRLKMKKDAIFQLYSRTEYINKARKDPMWVEHSIAIIDSMLKIKGELPNYICPTSYNLNETLAIINSAQTRLSKMPVPFKVFWHNYGFFHGLEFGVYRMHIIRDNFELSDFGAILKICIGDDRYVDYLNSNEDFMAVIYKDDIAYACAHFKIKTQAEIQLLKKNNRYFSDDSPQKGPNSDDEWKLLVPWIKDVVSLNPGRIRDYISRPYAIKKLKELRESISHQEFKQLAATFGVDISDIFSNKFVEQEAVAKMESIPLMAIAE